MDASQVFLAAAMPIALALYFQNTIFIRTDQSGKMIIESHFFKSSAPIFAAITPVIMLFEAWAFFTHGSFIFIAHADHPGAAPLFSILFFASLLILSTSGIFALSRGLIESTYSLALLMAHNLLNLFLALYFLWDNFQFHLEGTASQESNSGFLDVMGVFIGVFLLMLVTVMIPAFFMLYLKYKDQVWLFARVSAGVTLILYVVAYNALV